MRLALAGGTVYISPADEPLRDVVVLIDGDKIEAVGNIATPPSVERLDCSGLTILAIFREHPRAIHYTLRGGKIIYRA